MRDASLRRLWGVPTTALGVVARPARLRERLFGTWHYWWQAHLLDCLLDAELRDPEPARRRHLAGLVRGHRWRNLGLTNSFHDDMAWWGLALLRAGDQAGLATAGPARVLGDVLATAWDAAPQGGIPWRIGDTVRNAPANGPAGILLARLGDLGRARAVAAWLDERLIDQETGLVLDGVHDDGRLDRRVFTYCQGVVIGLEVELAVATGETVHEQRAADRIRAVDRHLARAGVLAGCSGGDGGLFAGITARYLADAARRLPGRSGPAQDARETAAGLVLTSADAAWRTRSGTGFRQAWADPASPVGRELSVQLSAWMLLEAAASVGVAGRAGS